MSTIVQNTPGTFRFTENGLYTPYPFQWNVRDQVLAPTPSNNGGWTTGATILDNLDIGAPAQKTLNITQVSVSAKLRIELAASPPAPGGKFGKIVTGLCTAQVSQTITAYGPYVQELLAIPTDRSLITDLWDPAVNDLPGSYRGDISDVPGQPLPVFAEINPQLPHVIPGGGGGLLIGIWMLPSLMNGGAGEPSASLQVTEATYSIDYSYEV